MCKITDIAILICSQDLKHIESVIKTIRILGLTKIFVAESHFDIERIITIHKIDIALIDIDFNGTGGFKTGDQLLAILPNLFVLLFSESENLINPIRTIFSNASDFIFKNNESECKKKIKLWANVAMNTRNVREFCDA